MKEKNKLIKFEDWKANWYYIANYKDGNVPPDFEIQVYKKLLDIFHVGPYYYFVFNVPKVQMEFVSDSVTEVLGIEADMFTPGTIFDRMDDEDRALFLHNEKCVSDFFKNMAWEDFFNYKVCYDFRIKDHQGQYKWIYHQVVAMQCEHESIVRTLGVHTDISSFKTGEVPMKLKIVGLNGAPTYYGPEYVHESKLFSDREKEIIKLIYEGLTSDSIAERLFISVHTVRNHRKKIMRKAHVQTTPELIAKCLKEGLL